MSPRAVGPADLSRLTTSYPRTSATLGTRSAGSWPPHGLLADMALRLWAGDPQLSPAGERGAEARPERTLSQDAPHRLSRQVDSSAGELFP